MRLLGKLICLCLPLLLSIAGQGQQGNNWYFGFNSGVTFNTNPPTGLTPSSIYTNEGSASISDANGNLLLYTDGSVVYNKNHQAIPGSGLMGHFSSTQSAMIIQKPGSDNLYYIFTSPSIESDLTTGYYYCLIDMTMNGGLGGVAQNNTFLYAPATEKLTASRHANGIDVWAITLENVSNRFKTYHVDCNNVSVNPVVSNTGDLISGPGGYMKASPDGNFLALGTTEFTTPNKFLRLYRFDNATGMVSQPIKLPVLTLVYGVEFSPDSKIVYATAYPAGDTIYQWSLLNYDSASIASSRYKIPTTRFSFGLQNGPDGKLYVSHPLTYSLGEISSPNVLGPGCNYTDSTIELFGQCRSGLTNTMPNLVANTNAEFTYSIHPDCSTVDFAGTTLLQDPVSWFWEFGDGNTSTLQNPTHVFPGNPNEFLVKLKVTLLNGCGFAQRSKSINFIRPLVQANFTSNPECGNLTVTFSNTSTISTGVINAWFWEFGDGNTSTQQSPVHSYLSTGSYQVRLTATYSTGCVVAHSVTKQLNVNPKPAALFSANEVCAGFPTVFTDQSTITSGTVTGWYWNFGDGITSSLQHPTHVYATGGSYVVKIVAKSTAGCDSDTTFHTITVNHKPVAGFTFSDNCVSAPVQFQNSSTAINATINQWFWNFGDGGNSTAMNPSHTYATGGSFEIKHAVTTDKGCLSDTLRKTISIDAKPLALFTLANGCTNSTLFPTNSSATAYGNIGSYYWDFGNGNTSTETLPGINYVQPGPYTVKLVAYSQNGCKSDTAQAQIIIESYPTVDFEFGPACVGKEINFQNLTTNEYGPITTWTWSFGNGNTSNLFNPSYTYNNYGNYAITLKAFTLNGCESDDSKSIDIRKIIIYTGADTTIVKGQPLQLGASGAFSYTWSPGLYLSNPNIANPVAVLPGNMEYAVKGTTSEGCVGEAKINIKVFEENRIYVPSAFTPNGDGLNDVLKPIIPGIAKLEYFSVYNRWGELVFTTKEIGKGWDGKISGTDQPNAVFVWIVGAIDYQGLTIRTKGTTTLVR